MDSINNCLFTDFPEPKLEIKKKLNKCYSHESEIIEEMMIWITVEKLPLKVT